MQTLFNNRYKIIKTIGSGGMGTVYLAESVSLGTRWAIKAIEKKESSNFDLLAEPNILKKLKHHALPRIVDIEEDDNFLYVIEDYIEGNPLDKQLKLRKSFDEATVIEWAKQLCEVLIYLHNQKPNPIIYRDMKPSNIIVSSNNKVSLIDFGIAREFKNDSGSDTSYMGTRGYAAPEQYGTSQTDERTDIYSLGVTIYHLLTGKSPNEPPYEFRQLRQLNKSFSEGIEFIVSKCVQNNPVNRYQNVDELLKDLENIYMFNSYYKKQKAFEKIKYLIKAGMVIGFSFLIYLSSGVIMNEKTERYDNFINQGYDNLRMYQFDEATNAFNEANKMIPKNKNSYLGIAQVLFKQANYKECTSYLDSLTTNLPEISEDAKYNYLKGSVFYENKDYVNAIHFFEMAVDEDKNNTEYARDLAVSYSKNSDIAKARSILNSIIEDGSADDILEYVNSQVLLAEGKNQDAIEGFNRVIKISNDEIIKKKAYIEIANIYKDARKENSDDKILQNEIATLEQAVKDLKDQDDLIITEMMAEAYFKSQNYELSLEKFQKLLNIGYDRSYIYRNIAIIYQQIKHYSDAEDILMKMKEKYQDDYKCYLQLAFLYLEEEGQKSEDSRDYNKVIENYNLAVQFAPEKENTSDLIPLHNKIGELKQKGWI